MNKEYDGTFGMGEPPPPPTGGYLFAMPALVNRADGMAEAAADEAKGSKYQVVYKSLELVRKHKAAVVLASATLNLADQSDQTRWACGWLFEAAQRALDAETAAGKALGIVRGHEKLEAGEPHVEPEQAEAEAVDAQMKIMDAAMQLEAPAFPDGYDLQVKQDGVPLSGGVFPEISGKVITYSDTFLDHVDVNRIEEVWEGGDDGGTILIRMTNKKLYIAQGDDPKARDLYDRWLQLEADRRAAAPDARPGAYYCLTCGNKVEMTAKADSKPKRHRGFGTWCKSLGTVWKYDDDVEAAEKAPTDGAEQPTGTATEETHADDAETPTAGLTLRCPVCGLMFSNVPSSVVPYHLTHIGTGCMGSGMLDKGALDGEE